MTASRTGPPPSRGLSLRAGTVLATLLATLLLVAAPATAAPAAGGVAAASPPAPGDGSLLVIMDVSGSMQRADAGGTTLIDGARRAVTELVRSVPDDAVIGLRLYGDRYAGDDEARGCRDSRLAVRPGAAGRTGDRIVAAIERARPTGFTPIGYALTRAAEDVAPEGERSVVLVSDGEDTCGDPEPCAAARALSRRGIDVRVNTVGLALSDDPAARRQLRCIAEATGGTYVPADDAAQLSEELTEASTRALQRFQADGEAITGEAETEATAIEPGTAYTDGVLDGESRWYSLDLQEGDRLTATFTDDGDPEYGCCLFAQLVDPAGRVLATGNGVGLGTATTTRVNSAGDGVPESGTYTVSTRLEVSDRRLDVREPVSYEMQVNVEAADPAVPATGPPGPDGPSQATVTETVTATPEPAPASQESATPASDEGGGLLVGVTVVLGLLVLGLGAALVVLWRRLRAVTGG